MPDNFFTSHRAKLFEIKKTDQLGTVFVRYFNVTISENNKLVKIANVIL